MRFTGEFWLPQPDSILLDPDPACPGALYALEIDVASC
jgi:hypothetical protein